jgi:hypothetical protein
MMNKLLCVSLLSISSVGLVAQTAALQRAEMKKLDWLVGASLTLSLGGGKARYRLDPV